MAAKDQRLPGGAETVSTMTSEVGLYHELTYYTLAHGDPAFIHQHVVDAYAAQNADETTKPIAIVFALIGLYLHVERGFTGKQVQRAHMTLAKRRKAWIRPQLPMDRGAMRVTEMLAAEPGPARDAKISAWSAAVWEAFSPCH